MKKVRVSKNHKIGISLSDNDLNKCNYYFYKSNELEKEYLNKELPMQIGGQSELGKRIKTYIDPKKAYNSDYLNEKYDEILKKLDTRFKNLKESHIENQETKQLEEEEQLELEIKNSVFLFSTIENPLHFIACLMDWFCAGERLNTTLSFLVYASEIVLKNPISVVARGEASSGKSHVFKTALKFIPQDYIIKDKRPTFQAMINRAKEDIYYYDGKVVFLGDMGGEDDKDEAKDCLNILKELQTDGEISSSKNVKVGSDWLPADFVLKGKPCLSYTTVPNNTFDNQELSRMILITPRTDNIEEYNLFSKSLEFQGKSLEKQKEYENVVKTVPYLLLSLQEKFKDVKIINPYKNSLMEFLKSSESYKRDIEKYNYLIHIICVLNNCNKDFIENNGDKILLVSKRDVYMFKQLLLDYEESINLNLTKTSTEVLREMEKYLKYDEYIADPSELDSTTINEFYLQSEIKLSKGHLRKAFTELNQEGYIQVVSKEGKSYVYALTSKNTGTKPLKLNLNEDDIKMMEYERGIDFVKSVKENDLGEINLLSQHKDVEKPIWQNYEVENDKGSV